MLSELDALERSLKLNELSVPEKDRLNRLNKQASREAEKELTEIESGELSSDGSVPNIPSLDNSFKRDANASKKADPKKKTKKKKNEEEELNLLMMQN